MFKTISQEAIKYQANDSFFPKLTRLIEEMYSDIDNGKYRDNIDLLKGGYSEKIEKLIKNRFNINVKVDPEISFVAPLAILPFSSDQLNQMSGGVPKIDSKFMSKLNPFNDRDIENAIARFNDILLDNKATAKHIDGKRGSINFANATVTGYLAEVNHYMVFNLWFIKEVGGLTPAELAAATIHEIGHAFTGLEYHFKKVTTNNAIAEVMHELNNNDIEKATYVFKSRFGAKELEEAQLSKDSTREDFAGAIAARYMKVMDSQYQSGFYDATSFEYLSDNFATKLGAGAALTSGLDKLNTKFNYGINRRKWINFWNYLETWLLWLMWSLTGYGGIFGFFWLIYILFAGTIWIKSVPIYDNFRDRHSRVSNEIANILKDVKLPKGEKENLINQYEMVKSIENINFNYEPYAAKIVGIFVPSFRRNKYYKRKQQVVESALSNGLFVSAAKMELV